MYYNILAYTILYYHYNVLLYCTMLGLGSGLGAGRGAGRRLLRGQLFSYLSYLLCVAIICVLVALGLIAVYQLYCS